MKKSKGKAIGNVILILIIIASFIGLGLWAFQNFVKDEIIENNDVIEVKESKSKKYNEYLEIPAIKKKGVVAFKNVETEYQLGKIVSLINWIKFDKEKYANSNSQNFVIGAHHYDVGNKGFAKLNQVKKGNKVIYYNKEGTKLTYEVYLSKKMPRLSENILQLPKENEPKIITLLSCPPGQAITWSAYADYWVVQAKLINSEEYDDSIKHSYSVNNPDKPGEEQEEVPDKQWYDFFKFWEYI